MEFPAEPNYPARAPVDAYGNGGFRFADMSHRGSILIGMAGIWIWPVERFEQVSVEAFQPLLSVAQAPELLLLGTGTTIRMAQPEWREVLRKHGIRLEVMDTGAAARTFNVLLAEQRNVGAALIAVP